jgi:hypothetical protein
MPLPGFSSAVGRLRFETPSSRGTRPPVPQDRQTAALRRTLNLERERVVTNDKVLCKAVSVEGGI